MNNFRIWGRIGKDGKEVLFKTFNELKMELEKRTAKEELKRTNLEINIRNEVRKRKAELREKTLKLAEKPETYTNITWSLCEMIENGEKYDGLFLFVKNEILRPLVNEGLISEISLKQISGPLGITALVPVIQTTKFIDTEKKYPSIILEEEE